MWMYRSLKNRMNILARCEQGLAFIEFALCVSVLIIMFIGAIEVSRYILIVQKVEKTIDTLADVFTQTTTGNLTSTQVTNYINAAPLLMSPYPMGANGIVILTDIETPNTSTVPTVNWQVCGSGSGTMLAAPSEVAANTASGSATYSTLPNNFTMNAGEEVIVGEMYYQFTPILAQGLVPSAIISRFTYFRPRFKGEKNGVVSSAVCP